MADSIAPIRTPSAWTGSELRERTDWIWTLRPDELEDLERALSAVRRSGLAACGFGAADFPLSVLGERLEAVRHELVAGRGFVLLRGLDVADRPFEDVSALYWGLGCHLGTVVSQNAKGMKLERIEDRGVLKPGATPDPNLRSYVTNERQYAHSDQSDVVSLMCVEKAMHGGESVVVSAHAIYNRIARTRPELLELLRRGFFHDLRGEVQSGDLNATSDVRVPVFAEVDGVFRSWFHGKKIRHGQRKRGMPLSGLEAEAVEMVEGLAEDPELRLDMTLERGDIQLLNNFSMLHYRMGFEDGGGRKRLMLRLWIELDRFGPMDPAMARWARCGVDRQDWAFARPHVALGEV
jgi:hypothetical protein